VVLTVAQQTPRKGIYDFLALSHEHTDTRFVWVGGFPYGRFSQDYSIIEEKKSRCGKNVIFTGFVDDITAAYCSADVFFMPSYAEGLPMVALEAFATGLPVRRPEDPRVYREFQGDRCLLCRISRRQAHCLRTGVCSNSTRHSPARLQKTTISERLQNFI